MNTIKCTLYNKMYLIHLVSFDSSFQSCNHYFHQKKQNIFITLKVFSCLLVNPLPIPEFLLLTSLSLSQLVLWKHAGYQDSFFHLNVFEIHLLRICTTLFYYWVVLHFMNIIQFNYPLFYWWIFQFSPGFGLLTT